MSLKRRIVLLAVLVLGSVAALSVAAGGSASTDVQRCTITGTNGNNVLRGTSRADVICGRGGNDTIRGFGGNDTLDGGPGSDTIVGGRGNDVMVGGTGNDAFFAGGEGADRLSGGPGRDRAVLDRRDRALGVEVRRFVGGGAATPLPPLPAEVRTRGRWAIGVKCDAPPFGYIDVRGRNAGFEVDVARWFSRFAFGRADRVTFECAPTPTREPLLTGGRVDLVLATFTYTADRDTRIDFSRGYYQATGRLLVRNNSPIRTLNDIRGRTVSTTSGSVYDRWVRRCFPQANLSVFDNFTNARLAFEQGRADTLMWDDTVLLPIAQVDPNVRLTNDRFLSQPYAIGIRQGNVAMKRWVDSRLELMRQRDLFMTLLRANVAAPNLDFFAQSILRPRQNFNYTPGADPTTTCP
jgi:polar amino acid transport system substrate-binding protein